MGFFRKRKRVSLLGPSLCPEGNARTWTRDHREISGRTEVIMYALICCREHGGSNVRLHIDFNKLERMF